MSIATHYTNAQHLECYLFNLFQILLNEASQQQLSQIKTALTTITRYLEEGRDKQSISDHISYFSDLLTLPSITYNITEKELKKHCHREFKAFYRSITGKHNFISIKYVIENLICAVLKDNSPYFDKLASLTINYHLPKNIKVLLGVKPNLIPLKLIQASTTLKQGGAI